MPKSAVVSICRKNEGRTQEQRRPAPDPDPFKPLSTVEAMQAIHAVIEMYPPEVGDCFGLGTELGLYEGQVIWTARNELLCWWLTPPETYLERRRQFDEICEQLRRLVIVIDDDTLGLQVGHHAFHAQFHAGSAHFKKIAAVQF